MAKETQVKTKIAVDGEAQYKDACKQIKGALKELSSEMKITAAEFAGNENSIEALTSKQSILKRKLEEQNKEVAAAEAALASMAKGGVEPSSEAYQKMQTNLNYAKAAVQNTKNEIQSLTTKMQEQSGAWNAMKNAAGGAGETLGKIGAATAQAAKAVAAVGAAAAGAAGALAAMTVSSSNYADELLTTSTNTHIASEDLQKYSYALKFIDGDMNTLTGSMKKNTMAMDKARDGNKNVQDAYNQLGISVTDANGQLRDGQSVYWEVIDALGAVKNETERDALAMTLLGKNATELNTVIDAGSGAFKALGDEAEAMGAVMSGDNISALGAFNDKMEQVKAGVGGLKNAASMIALPFLDDLAAQGAPILADFTKSIQAANGDMSKLGGALGTGVTQAVNLLAQKAPEFIDMGVSIITALVQGIVDSAPAILEAGIEILTSLVTAIGENLPMLIDTAGTLILELATGISAALPTLIPTVISIILEVANALIGNIPKLIEAALKLMVGLAQGLIAAIPTVIAKLPEIINSIISALLGSIPLIIEAGISLLSALIDGLPDIIIAVVEAIPQIISGIITALMDNIPALIQAGFDLFVALVTALPEICIEIWNAIPQIISGIVTSIGDAFGQIASAGKELFCQLVGKLQDAIKYIVKRVPEIATGIVKKIKEKFSEFKEIGKNMIKGIWNGINDAAAWLWDKVTGWAKGLLNGIKGLFGIHSPSRVFAGIGKFMALGLGEGFTQEMRAVSEDIRRETASAIPPRAYLERARGGAIAQGAQVSVVQNIYANNTSYAQQQREAARRFERLAREVIA